MAKRKPTKPTTPPPSPAQPAPRRSKAGRPRITPPGAGPVRRLVVTDLGPYPARCLAEIKAAMAAREGLNVTDAAVVRLALALAAVVVETDGIAYAYAVVGGEKGGE